MTTEERQQEKYKQWISELGFRAMDAEKLEEYIIEKSVIQRELTVKERQFLHIVNGTSHKFTENTTCYYCDDKVTEGMMCEDCRAERLGDCDGCGKRIISKAYATDGISRDTKLPLNLCRVCMREHGRCSNMEGHRQCEHVVKMKDCLCDTCHNAYCTEHTQHEHMGYNGHQREYHHKSEGPRRS